jgi:hypothetical protein
MPDSSLPTSAPEQVVRFRMRTLLAVTAVVAVLAAIAGPFYRRQSPEAQQVLLVYWSCAGVGTGLWMYYMWRNSWRLPNKAGSILCVLWTTGRGGNNFMSRPIVTLLFMGFWLGFFVMQSNLVAGRGHATSSFWLHTINGFTHGMMASGVLLMFAPQPFYLCENGVAVGPGVIPWNYIRSAQWVATTRSVLRLHRLDGDLFVRVPDHLRDGVQKLVAERTRFVGDAVHLAPSQ